MGQQKVGNRPFSGDQVELPSGAALLGLTPETISRALLLKLSADELREKSLSEIYDRMYKAALTQAITPVTEIEGIPATAEQALDYKIRTMPKAERELTDDIREYDYYVAQEIAAGRTPKSFEEWMTSIRRAGATTISLSPEERVVSTERGKARTPIIVSDILEDAKKTDPVWYGEFIAERDKREKARKLLNKMTARLKMLYPNENIRLDEEGNFYISKGGEKRVIGTFDWGVVNE